MSGADRSDEWEVRLKEQSQSLERTRTGLEGWMRRTLDDPAAVIGELTTPGGTGVANETVLFDVRRGDGSSKGYVARLATPDPLYLDFDLALHHRMYESMMAFPQVPTPAVLPYEPDLEVVGAPFFVMERIDGVVPADNPSWAAEGFVVEATPQQRRKMWEQTVDILCALHRLPTEAFGFLRTGATDSGAGDLLEYWTRYRRWAEQDGPAPLVEQAEEWLVANQPRHTGLSWGDSRLPNVIYRDHSPVGILDWDLVSLGGAQADLAWWMIMDPQGDEPLVGIGTHQDLVDRWEATTGQTALDLRWYLVFGAYRLAGIFTKLFGMMADAGHLPPDAARNMIDTGHHVGLIAGLLDLTPPDGVTPVVPTVRLDR